MGEREEGIGKGERDEVEEWVDGVRGWEITEGDGVRIGVRGLRVRDREEVEEGERELSQSESIGAGVTHSSEGEEGVVGGVDRPETTGAGSAQSSECCERRGG